MTTSMRVAPSRSQSAHHEAALRASDLSEVDVWALMQTIDEMEAELGELRAELADARRSRGPVAGGPPREWDRWIMELPDAVFLDCLGPKDSEARPASLPRRTPRGVTRQSIQQARIEEARARARAEPAA